MIFGLGTDLVRAERFSAWDDTPRLAERWFHPQELEGLAERGPRRWESLAARFGAKEAFSKALGRGLVGLRLNEIAVVKENTGRPRLILEGRTRALFESLVPRGRLHLSLSHDGGWALATVIIEHSTEADGE